MSYYTKSQRHILLAGLCGAAIVMLLASCLSSQPSTTLPATAPSSTSASPTSRLTALAEREATRNAKTTLTAEANATRRAYASATALERTQIVYPTATIWAQQTIAAYPTSTAQANATATAWSLALAEFNILMESGSAGFPLGWPPQPFTDEQIVEATDCDVQDLVINRYPDDTDMDSLPAIYPPVTSCDWATLTAGYGYLAEVQQVPAPEVSRKVYLHTLSLNPAFAIKSWVFYGNFAPGLVVQSPAANRPPIRSVSMHFSFRGSGYQADALAIIKDADSVPQLNGSIVEENSHAANTAEAHVNRALSGTIDPALVQNLAASLTDLMPIDAQFNAIACPGWYPDWEVTLTFTDGSVILLATNGTNLLDGGGPWQTNIDGQDYMLVSGVFLDALNKLSTELRFPGGATTDVMDCGGSSDFIEYAFPTR
jgi:hypothetical protein